MAIPCLQRWRLLFVLIVILSTCQSQQQQQDDKVTLTFGVANTISQINNELKLSNISTATVTLLNSLKNSIDAMSLNTTLNDITNTVKTMDAAIQDFGKLLNSSFIKDAAKVVFNVTADNKEIIGDVAHQMIFSACWIKVGVIALGVSTFVMEVLLMVLLVQCICINKNLKK